MDQENRPPDPGVG